MATKMTDGSVGMMDPAYFCGKAKILSYFNDLLQINLTKIEETASGAVACQLTEYVFPGSIPMQRVNWEAKSDFEFVSNYKLLQVAFKKNHVQRHVEVEKLIRAKYQDNLEFCQWLKAFVERSGADRSDSYDPVAVRAKGKGGKAYNERMSGGAARKAGGSRHVTTASAGRPVTTTKPRVPTRPTPAKTSTTSSRPVTTTITTSARSTNTKEPLKQSSGNKVGVASTSTNKAEADAALMKRNDELEAKNSELESTIQKLEENGIEMEREKDFYFEKLRHVELLLQIKQGSNFEGCDLQNVVDSIFKVLYATAEDNIQIDEEGEVVTQEGLAQQPSELSEDVSADLSAALGNEDQLFGDDPAPEVMAI